MVSAAEQSKDAAKFQLPQLQFNDSQEQVTIENGFGFTQGNGLKQIPEGSIIYHSSDSVTRVFDSDGKQLLIANDTDSEMIRNASSSWHFQVPNGSLIKPNINNTQVFSDGKLIVTVIYEKPNTPIVKLMDQEWERGWIEEAKYLTIPNLVYFRAKWIVPLGPSPNSSRRLVQSDLFPAIQPHYPSPGPNPSIMQPVLGWSYNSHWYGFAE
jgi:hypothetical protein